MKKLYFLLLSLSVLTACDKETETPGMAYPTTFTSRSISNTTPVIMFSSNGEVKDAARIKSFAGRYSDWYYLEDKVVNVDADQKITFRSAGEAEVTTNGKSESFEIKKDGEFLILTSKVEGTVMEPAGNEYFTSLSAAILKYKPIVSDKQPVPSSTGYTYTYKTRSRFITSLKADEVNIHRMVFTLKRTNSHGGSSMVSSGVSNVFDAAGVSLLQPGDTLVVQSFVGTAVKE